MHAGIFRYQHPRMPCGPSLSRSNINISLTRLIDGLGDGNLAAGFLGLVLADVDGGLVVVLVDGHVGALVCVRSCNIHATGLAVGTESGHVVISTTSGEILLGLELVLLGARSRKERTAVLEAGSTSFNIVKAAYDTSADLLAVYHDRIRIYTR